MRPWMGPFVQAAEGKAHSHAGEPVPRPELPAHKRPQRDGYRLKGPWGAPGNSSGWGRKADPLRIVTQKNRELPDKLRGLPEKAR